MADVSVDVAEVKRVAAQLNDQSAGIVADLTGLLSAVQTLLADPAGGLWMQKASPVLTASYSEFSKMLSDAINNIPEFASSFVNVADQLQKMDNTLSQPPPSK